MRFKLTIEVQGHEKNVLPLNYQYELSSWIYRVFNHGNPEFSAWLHDHGYTDHHKSFKLFTFSNLDVPHRHILGDRMEITSRTIGLTISMLPEEMVSHFISGIFRDQEFQLGDRISQVSLKISTIERLPDPMFPDSLQFRSISPVLVSFLYPGERYARYLKPGDADYQRLLFRNLKEKYRMIHGKEHPFREDEGQFHIMGEPKKKGIVIKAGTPHESKIIGYTYDFRVTAPADLIRLGYYTGFGEKNSLGFGCAEVMNGSLA